MSDDLVKRLRDSTSWYHADCELKMKCADRIEAQAAEIERLEKACAEWAEVSQSNYQRAKVAEAKLAKAVEAFGCWNRMMNNPAYDMGEMVSEFDAIARTTLAELTGDNT